MAVKNLTDKKRVEFWLANPTTLSAMYGHKPYDIHFMYFPALKLGFIAKQSKQTNKKKKSKIGHRDRERKAREN